MIIRVDSEKLHQRVNGLSLIDNYLSTQLEEVLQSYRGMCFRNSQIDKFQFFMECLDLKLSKESEQFLVDKCRLDFHRDSRSSVHYGLDLVFGWIYEDLILATLRKRGISVQLAGEDRHREFLPASEIGTTSDFLLDLNGIRKPLEIVFAWNNHWTIYDRWDLRDSKYMSLVSAGVESLCLGIELPSLNGFLIDMQNPNLVFIKRANPAWGNKFVYTLTGVRDQLKSVDLVLEDFKQLLH